MTRFLEWIVRAALWLFAEREESSGHDAEAARDMFGDGLGRAATGGNE